MGEPGIKQHQMMARGEGILSGNFGCEDMQKSGGTVGPGHKEDSHLPDHKRGAKAPIGHNQANPDHGHFK